MKADLAQLVRKELEKHQDVHVPDQDVCVPLQGESLEQKGFSACREVW